MTPGQFCYWMRGLFEVGNPQQLDERQTAMVKEHLDKVFTPKAEPQREHVEQDHVCDRDVLYC